MGASGPSLLLAAVAMPLPGVQLLLDPLLGRAYLRPRLVAVPMPSEAASALFVADPSASVGELTELTGWQCTLHPDVAASGREAGPQLVDPVPLANEALGIRAFLERDGCHVLESNLPHPDEEGQLVSASSVEAMTAESLLQISNGLSDIHDLAVWSRQTIDSYGRVGHDSILYAKRTT